VDLPFWGLASDTAFGGCEQPVDLSKIVCFVPRRHWAGAKSPARGRAVFCWFYYMGRVKPPAPYACFGVVSA